MNTVMDAVKGLLNQVLNTFYESVVFDVEGLARMLLPCLIVLALALVLFILLKCFHELRRFAHLAITGALIVLIAASAFFPATLAQAGDQAAAWMQQTFFAAQEAEAE